MSYKHLYRLFDERRQKLSCLLQDTGVELKPSRKEQIQGAIAEIEMFLSTLRQFEERENSELCSQGESLINKIGSLLHHQGE